MARTVVSNRDIMKKLGFSKYISKELALKLKEMKEEGEKEETGEERGRIEEKKGPLEEAIFGTKLEDLTVTLAERVDPKDLNLTSLRADRYTERLLKYIPGEIIALYLALDAIIRSAKMVGSALHWGIFLFGVAATGLYLWRVEKVEKLLQLFISSFAYCVWVFALSGPFATTGWYNPVYGAILLPMYTFMIPIIEA